MNLSNAVLLSSAKYDRRSFGNKFLKTEQLPI